MILILMKITNNNKTITNLQRGDPELSGARPPPLPPLPLPAAAAAAAAGARPPSASPPDPAYNYNMLFH